MLHHNMLHRVLPTSSVVAGMLLVAVPGIGIINSATIHVFAAQLRLHVHQLVQPGRAPKT